MQIQQQNQQSHEKNEFLSEQYFQLCKKRKNELQNKFQQIRINVIPSELSERLKKNIEQKMDNLDNALNKCYIYIVIMGTISSGKSTFLNALLGHELLSSKNQNCTSKATYIGHQNVNANQNTNITINEQNFDSVKKAAKYLVTIRDNPQVKIRTQSYFHRNLSQEYQDRIIFVDTPGIQLVNCTPKKDKQQIDKAVDVGVCPPKDYKEQIDEINEQIQLDEHSIRINVWVSDYTTFDRDKEIQKNIISKLIGSVKQYQQQIQNHEENQIQQSNEVNQLFFIINKFDQRSKTKDDKIEVTLEGIKSVFYSENIFKISASQALNYIILNYGTEQEKEKFKKEFYKNNEEIHNLQNIDDAKNFCELRIKNNHKLIEAKETQDFKIFLSKISTRIKLEVEEMFNPKFVDITQRVGLLDFRNEFENVKEQLTNEQRTQISVLLNTFQQKKQDYLMKLQNLKITFVEQIVQIIEKTKTEINKKNQEEVIQEISICTIAKLDELYQNIYQVIHQSNRLLLDKLKLIFPQQEYNYIIYLQCELILNSLMEDSVLEQKKQFIQTQANELYQKLDIKVNQYFYEKLAETNMDKIINFSSIIGGGFSSFVARFGVQTGGIALFDAIIAGGYSVGVAASSVAGIGLAVGVVAYYGFKLLKNQYDIFRSKSKLDEWKSSLDQQSEKLVNDYIKIYDDCFEGIRELMERIIQ